MEIYVRLLSFRGAGIVNRNLNAVWEWKSLPDVVYLRLTPLTKLYDLNQSHMDTDSYSDSG